MFPTKSPSLLRLLSSLGVSCKDEHFYVYEDRGPNAFGMLSSGVRVFPDVSLTHRKQHSKLARLLPETYLEYFRELSHQPLKKKGEQLAEVDM